MRPIPEQQFNYSTIYINLVSFLFINLVFSYFIF